MLKADVFELIIVVELEFDNWVLFALRYSDKPVRTPDMCGSKYF
jgi:hypothetical protein